MKYIGKIQYNVRPNASKSQLLHQRPKSKIFITGGCPMNSAVKSITPDIR